jgi:hypothetical protein
MRKVIPMHATMGDVTVVGEMVIEDVWYSVRHPGDGSLIAIGVWLPPPGDNVVVSKVDEAAVPQLLQELAARIAS